MLRELVGIKRFKERIDPLEVEVYSQKFSHLFRYILSISNIINHQKEIKYLLDLGCGTGYGSYLMKKLMPGLKLVISLDIDYNALLYAKNKYSIQYCVNSDIMFLPFRSNIFDAVICLEVIEHVKKHSKVFNEIRRCLKDQGILVISTPNKSYKDVWEIVLKVFSKIVGKQFTLRNPYHVGELGYREVIEVSRKNGFKLAKSYGLFIMPSRILPRLIVKYVILAPLKLPFLALDVLYVFLKFRDSAKYV